MKLLRYLLFIFPFLLISCDDDKDEPYADLFSIDVELGKYGGEVQIIKHECEVTINGKQQYIQVSLSGNFDNLNLRPPIQCSRLVYGYFWRSVLEYPCP